MIGKRIKRDTQLVVLSVIVLSIITLRFSYSAFFTVKSVSKVQEIETGNMDVDVSIVYNEDPTLEMFPTTIEEICCGNSNKYSTITIKNNGNLNSDFSVSVGYDFDALKAVVGNKSESELVDSLISLDYLKVAIQDANSGSADPWINFSETGINRYPTISSLIPTEDNPYMYPVLRNSVDVNEQKVYLIYIWLTEDVPESEIGKYIYLKINVKSVVKEETISEEIVIEG